MASNVGGACCEVWWSRALRGLIHHCLPNLKVAYNCCTSCFLYLRCYFPMRRTCVTILSHHYNWIFQESSQQCKVKCHTNKPPILYCMLWHKPHSFHTPLPAATPLQGLSSAQPLLHVTHNVSLIRAPLDVVKRIQLYVFGKIWLVPIQWSGLYCKLFFFVPTLRHSTPLSL